jgi:hypothetical protein
MAATEVVNADKISFLSVKDADPQTAWRLGKRFSLDKMWLSAYIPLAKEAIHRTGNKSGRSRETT